MHNPSFSHGDDGYRFNTPIVADFSSNVWMGGTPDGLLAHLTGKLSLIGNYPQLHAESLTEAYAIQHGVDSSQVLVANGTAEAIFLIARHFQHQHSTIVIPTFSEYEHACTLYQHMLGFVSVDDIPSIERTQPGLFWWCHPNNPTGHCFDGWQVEQLVGANPQTVFVIDEAYVDLCAQKGSLADVVNRHHNLLVLRSMTKHHTIPGLRLGYLLGNAALVQSIAAFQPPWSVNALAIEAGHYLLAHRTTIDVGSWLEKARLLRETLVAVTGWKAMPSSTAYFLMEAPMPATLLKQILVERYGILIRDASNFRGLGANHFRICAQSDEKNRLLVAALKALAEGKDE